MIDPPGRVEAGLGESADGPPPPPGDFATFAAMAAILPHALRIEAARADQRARWLLGERVEAERYLEVLPGLLDDPEAVLDLAHGEFLAREALGDRPEVAGFLARFPHHEATLGEQIELHLALAALHESTILSEADSQDADPRRARLTNVDPLLAADPFEGDPSHFRSWIDPLRGSSLACDFGRYRIRKLLGWGGMGEVYMADDQHLGRPVALKVANQLRGDTRRIARFRREAALAATFSDPRLCPVYDVGEFQGVHFFTMPLLSGQPLSDLLKSRGPFPVGEALALAAEIAGAMRIAHEAGVIHRDLKPANIMVGESGAPIIMDFGLARRLQPMGDTVTAADVLLGTPTYSAPEQIGLEKGALGPAADVYSLGAILYEMLAGEPPFTGGFYELIAKVVAGDPPPPSGRRPGLDPRIDRICLRALARKPADRFPSMAAFADAIEALRTSPRLAEPPAISSLVGPDQGRWTRTTTRRTLMVTGVVLGLGLFGWHLARPEGGDASDPLAPGSRWEGRFRFRAPLDYSGDVQVEIHGRSGASFRALQRTEAGLYAWEIEGELCGDAIRWRFVRAIRDNPGHTIVGRAKVEGSLVGDRMDLVFTDPGDSLADIWLVRPAEAGQSGERGDPPEGAVDAPDEKTSQPQ